MIILIRAKPRHPRSGLPSGSVPSASDDCVSSQKFFESNEINVRLLKIFADPGQLGYRLEPEYYFKTSRLQRFQFSSKCATFPLPEPGSPIPVRASLARTQVGTVDEVLPTSSEFNPVSISARNPVIPDTSKCLTPFIIAVTDRAIQTACPRLAARNHLNVKEATLVGYPPDTVSGNEVHPIRYALAPSHLPLTVTKTEEFTRPATVSKLGTRAAHGRKKYMKKPSGGRGNVSGLVNVTHYPAETHKLPAPQIPTFVPSPEFKGEDSIPSRRTASPLLTLNHPCIVETTHRISRKSSPVSPNFLVKTARPD